jgi:DivIVA domain-containing protein
MIDLTPLDVRNKRGDFKKTLRGYDSQEVDVFLELVAERLEEVVREVLQLRERAESLQQQVSSQTGREKAVQEALVSAQEFRTEMRGQAQREADLVIQEAQAEGRRQRAEAEAEVRMMLRDAERRLEQGRDALEEMERRRNRFLKAYRQLLEREMDVVEVEEGNAPLEERPIDLDLGGGRHRRAAPAAQAPIGPDEVPADIADLAPDDDDVRPPLDAPIDELAARFDPSASDRTERDLFSPPDAQGGAADEEDSRWS